MKKLWLALTLLANSLIAQTTLIEDSVSYSFGGEEIIFSYSYTLGETSFYGTITIESEITIYTPLNAYVLKQTNDGTYGTYYYVSTGQTGPIGQYGGISGDGVINFTWGSWDTAFSALLKANPIVSVAYYNGRFIQPNSTNEKRAGLTEKGNLGPKKQSFWETLIGDPVDIVTGEFYEEETDLVTAGTWPIVWKKTYRSGDKTDNGIGTGWKTNHSGYLEMVSTTELKRVDENRSTIEFTQDTTDTTLWVPTDAGNPTLRHLPNEGNVLREKITKTVESSVEIYTHFNPETGITTRYETKSFPITIGGVTIQWDPLESTCRHASLSIL